MAMSPEEPDEIDLLLPWHASGRLGPDDRDRVAAALAHDPGKRRMLARIEAERTAVIEANEAIIPPEAALTRLMAEAGAQPAKPASPHVVRARSWLIELFAPPSLAFSLATLLVAALAGAVLTYGLFIPKAGYDVAGGGGQETKRPVVIVAFADDARASAIQEALRQAGASISSGPKGGNFFEITFRQNPDLAPVEERIRQLAARTDLVRHLSRAGE